MEQPEGVGNSSVRLISVQKRDRKTRRGRRVFRELVRLTSVLGDAEAAAQEPSVKTDRTGAEGKDL